MHTTLPLDPELISIREGCRRLSVGRTTLYGLISSRKLRVIKIGRRSLLLRSEVNAFIAALASEQRP